MLGSGQTAACKAAFKAILIGLKVRLPRCIYIST